MTNRTEQQSAPHIEPRVSRLESIVEGLDEDIKSLSSNFDRMAKNTSDALQRQYDVIERQGSQFNASISVLQTTIAGSGKANWPVLLSACGVVLAIGALAAQPFRERLVGQEDRLDRLQTSVTAVTTDVAAQHVINTEIETQFRAAKELEEMRYEMGMTELRHVRELVGFKGSASNPP